MTLDATPQRTATGIGTLSLGAAVISESTTQQYSSEGAPFDAGAIDGTMPQYMETEIETPSLNYAAIGGAMGTGIPSLNSGAVCWRCHATVHSNRNSVLRWCNGNRNAVPEFYSNQRRCRTTASVEHFVSDISPRKCQTAEEVMHTFSRFKNRQRCWSTRNCTC